MSNIVNVPEVINAFNAYHNGNVLVGVSGEVQLPSLQAITETVSGAGIAGEYETGVIGNYGSIEQEVPFRLMEENVFALMKPQEPVDLTFRASQQSTVKATGALDYKGMRIVERGRFKSFNGGKLQTGKTQDAALTLEVLYYLVELDGNTLLEYDKLNSKFVVNGEDLMEKVRSLS